jgi:hypothetical protein
MATVQHSALTGSNLHEPKGVAAATVGQFYKADGAGSGVWTNREHILNVAIDNVNLAESTYVVSPYAGTIEKAYTVVIDNIPEQFGSDVIITLKIAGVNVTNGAITIDVTGQSAPAGTVDSCTPTAARTVTAGQAIQLSCNGLALSDARVWVTIVIKRTT